jgi:hypothetical protein
MALWTPKPPVERTASGFRINLDEEERDLLRALFGQFRSMLLGTTDEPALKRIFPAAYHRTEHAELDTEYQRLMREELVASRLTGLATVEEALSTAPPLTEEQITSFMQALNGLRLVLGTVLDVSEELEMDDIADDDPQIAEYHLYNFLSWLLEWTVRAMSGT